MLQFDPNIILKNYNDLKKNNSAHRNIFNKIGVNPKQVYDKIMNDETVTKDEIEYLNSEVSKQLPNDKKELLKIIRFYSKYFSNESLNWINVSLIKDMSFLFYGSTYNGDISKWDVSFVENMAGMFAESQFNQDISGWDVSKVTDMTIMFADSQFNQDISKWDVSKVTTMAGMFAESQFNQDISNWNVSNVKSMAGMFAGSQFEQTNINQEKISNVTIKEQMWK